MWVSASMHHALSGPHRAPVKMQFTAPGYYGATLFRTRSHEQLMPVEFCSGDRIQSLLWPPHEAATSLLSNTWGHFPHPDQGGAPKHLENPGKTPPHPPRFSVFLAALGGLTSLRRKKQPVFSTEAKLPDNSQETLGNRKGLEGWGERTYICLRKIPTLCGSRERGSSKTIGQNMTMIYVVNLRAAG